MCIFAYKKWGILKNIKIRKKGLFDEQFTIERLSEIGNPLEKISNVIDF